MAKFKYQSKTYPDQINRRSYRTYTHIVFVRNKKNNKILQTSYCGREDLIKSRINTFRQYYKNPISWIYEYRTPDFTPDDIEILTEEVEVIKLK